MCAIQSASGPVDLPVSDFGSCPLQGEARVSSIYRGLCHDRRHANWRVRIFYQGKQRHVGRFKDEETAARAYDKAAYFLYGHKAILNFSMAEAAADSSEVPFSIRQAKEQAFGATGAPLACSRADAGAAATLRPPGPWRSPATSPSYAGRPLAAAQLRQLDLVLGAPGPGVAAAAAAAASNLAGLPVGSSFGGLQQLQDGAVAASPTSSNCSSSWSDASLLAALTGSMGHQHGSYASLAGLGLVLGGGGSGGGGGCGGSGNGLPAAGAFATGMVVPDGASMAASLGTPGATSGTSTCPTTLGQLTPLGTSSVALRYQQLLDQQEQQRQLFVQQQLSASPSDLGLPLAAAASGGWQQGGLCGYASGLPTLTDSSRTSSNLSSAGVSSGGNMVQVVSAPPLPMQPKQQQQQQQSVLLAAQLPGVPTASGGACAWDAATMDLLNQQLQTMLHLQSVGTCSLVA